jgi:hypothetical protein
MSDHLDNTADTAAARPAGGDPCASAMRDNPYTVLSGLEPDHTMPAVLRVQQQLQRKKLRPEQDAALRAMRNLPARLSWDLLTLGTTPGASAGQWQRTRALLRDGRRGEALALWTVQAEPPGLHVRAVLCANEVCQQVESAGRAGDDCLRAFVARWAALLSRADWLATFAQHRCRTWNRQAPTAQDLAQLRERAEKRILALLEEGAGDEQRRGVWVQAWDQERAAIEAVARACGRRPAPPAWPGGHGPLGLADLGQEDSARAWLAETARSNTWPLPLTALKTGKASFYSLKAEETALAACAVQWLFSDLGRSAAQVWAGNGRAAWEALQKDEGGRMKDEQRHETPQGSSLPSSFILHPSSFSSLAWFGKGGAAQRARLNALEELKAEALLLRFQEELSRPAVPGEVVVETAGQLLGQAHSLRQPQAAVNQLETVLSGRLLACTEDRQTALAEEAERVVAVALEVRDLLLGRGAGRRCSQEVARLLLRRATAAWHRGNPHGLLPRPAVQSRVLRDLFRAADLAPHSSDVVINLGNAVLAISRQVRSRAEKQALLQRAYDCLKRCQEQGGNSPEMEECRMHVLEYLDPDVAQAEAIKKLSEATEG